MKKPTWILIFRVKLSVIITVSPGGRANDIALVLLFEGVFVFFESDMQILHSKSDHPVKPWRSK